MWHFPLFKVIFWHLALNVRVHEKQHSVKHRNMEDKTASNRIIPTENVVSMNHLFTEIYKYKTNNQFFKLKSY